MKPPRVGDPLVLTTVSILFLLGVFVLYTTTPIGTNFTTWLDSLVARQLLFGLVSFAVILVLSRIDLQVSKTFIIQIAALGIVVLLLAGLFFLGPIVNSTHRWYKIGQFLFQPSEFAKIVLALWSSFWLTSDHFKIQIRTLLGGGGVLLTLGLIILQPDFGATIISLLIVSSIGILWVLKYELGKQLVVWTLLSSSIVVLAMFSSWWLLLFLLIPLFYLFKQNIKAGMIGLVLLVVVTTVVGGIVLAWRVNIIPDYVKNRIESFVGAEEESFQVRQSKIAIGSGGMWGKGISQGTQSRLRFLPEYTTDFIYSAFIEERGFAGMLLLYALYLLLFGRLIFLALQVKDEYARLIIIGLTVKLWFETFLNLGMNMGVLPTKGVALPFMSYGGSSLLANSIIIGIILALYRYEAKRDTISPSFGLA